ncbi:gas vesicle protein [Streptomyces macrosporus]|uniref:Gas vesicle protein n=1 Tax=Streptomyces macrosporus TaxID=44032 RepID=A0ABN3JZN4_9ACTN
MSTYQERGIPAEAADTAPPAPARPPAVARGGAPAPRTLRPMEPRRDGEGSLAHVVETLLDKGLVLNADIMVSVAGVELLGIRLRAALASFETASRYGLEFPAGTDTETAAWREAREEKETCPECGKRVPVHQLLHEWCPWCGWRSAQARLAGDAPRALPEPGGSGGSDGRTVRGDRDGEDERRDG